MRAGRLSTASGTRREPITLLQRVTFTDDGGGGERRYEPVAEAYAHIRTLSSQEQFYGQATKLQVNYELEMYPYEGLDSSWRIGWLNKTFAIESVLDVDNRGRIMTLLCAEMQDLD